jgi:hypothetical protein
LFVGYGGCQGTLDGESSPSFGHEGPVEDLYGDIFGCLAADAALDHLNFKEDEVSHEREASSSLKFR